MMALIMPVAIILAAFAVDQGSLYTDRRDLQSLSDIAAITAAGNMTRAVEAASLVVQDNRNGGVSTSAAGTSYDPETHDTDQIDVIVEKGHYTGKASVPVAQRFQVGVTPFNAVRVSMRKGGDLYFGKSLTGTPLISTSSTAHIPAEAAFSIGSRLLSLNGGVVNEVLNKLLGTNLSLSVMDYEALANVNVSALDFLSGLATQLNLEAGTYDDVLNSNVTVGQIAKALAGISGSNQTAKLALDALGLKALDTAIPLRHLIDLGSVGRLGIGEKPQGLTVDTNVMDLLQASAALANAGKQVSLNLGANIPGLVSLTAKLAIGEPPQHSPFLAVGEPGTIVRTAQTRLYLSLKLLGSTQQVNGGLLLGLLNVNILSVEIPIYVEVAYAEARLTEISCPTGRPESLLATIAARPGVADIYIGSVDESKLGDLTGALPVAPAKVADVTVRAVLGLINLSVLQVYASAHTSITNVSETMKTFNKTEIDNKTVWTVSTRDVTTTLAQSLINNLTLSTTVLNSTLLNGLLSSILDLAKATVRSSIVSALTGTLDSLLYDVLSAIGIRIGEADIVVTGATCGRPVLVQ